MSGRNCDLLIYLLPALLFDILLCLGILFGIVCAQPFCHASKTLQIQALMGTDATQKPKKQVLPCKEWPAENLIPRSA